MGGTRSPALNKALKLWHLKPAVAFLGLDQDQRDKVFAATRAALQKIQGELKAATQKGVPPPRFNDDQMFSIQVMMLQHLTAKQVRTYFETVRGYKEPHHFEAYMTQLSPANANRFKALLEKDALPR